jgi:exodeoxyribonuclease V gamma subunit
LHAEHRAGLGLAACGEQNTWLFGLQRMLMGYAVGEGVGEPGSFRGAEPYAEVGGLEAALAGSLADLVTALVRWFEQARGSATPAVWAERGRTLLQAFFDPGDERDRATVAFRHCDRGRPHRGGRAHPRLRPHSGDRSRDATGDPGHA